MNSKVNYPNRIYLKQSSINGIYEFFHFIIENIILFRFIYFKNRPRNTYLLFRAFLATGLIFAVYYTLFSSLEFILFGIEVEPILLLMGFGTLGYWNMYSSFQKKCEYASGLFNDYVKEKARGNHEVADRLALNLSIQLLYLDLWGHRMFTDVLLNSIQKSIEYMAYNHPDQFNQEELIVKLTNRKMRVGELRYILIKYQNSLLDESKKDYTSAA